MVCYGGKDFARAYRTVRGNTVKAVEEIPESSLDFAPASGARTVRQLVTHIAMTDVFLGVHRERRTSFAGMNFPELVGQLRAEEEKPRTKAELLALLQERGEATAVWLEAVSDEVLAERFDQPPGNEPATKSRFEMIMGLKEHEMHHRAQLMLIQRMVGQVPHLTRAMQARFAAMAAQQPSQ